jgi:hypothetical protein
MTRLGLTGNEYVEAIRKPPQMCPPTVSFYVAVGVLKGCGEIAISGQPDTHSFFTPFLKWIVGSYNLDEIIVDREQFRELFGSDPEAFNYRLCIKNI